MRLTGRLTEVRVGEVGAVGELAGAGPVGQVLAGAAVHRAGLGDGLDQVLVVGVAPPPPADLRLAAAGDHCARALVPGERGAET